MLVDNGACCGTKKIDLSDIRLTLTRYPETRDSFHLQSIESTTYHFINISKHHHYHKMQVLLEGNLVDRGHTDPIKQQIIYKRHFYVDIAGN